MQYSFYVGPYVKLSGDWESAQDYLWEHDDTESLTNGRGELGSKDDFAIFIPNVEFGVSRETLFDREETTITPISAATVDRELILFAERFGGLLDLLDCEKEILWGVVPCYS